jgi:hypothetical protein
MSLDELSRIVECNPVNIWDFLTPILGVDIRLPVTVAFLGVTFLALWYLTTRWWGAAIVTGILAIVMQWLPGITMVGTFTAIGTVILVLVFMDRYILPSVKIERDLEYLPDGRLVLYKWLRKETRTLDNDMIIWRSPVQEDIWTEGRLHAHHTPKLLASDGIYGWYTRQDAIQMGKGFYDGPEHYLFRIAGENSVVWHTLGARVEDAEMLEVIL